MTVGPTMSVGQKANQMIVVAVKIALLLQIKENGMTDLAITKMLLLVN